MPVNDDTNDLLVALRHELDKLGNQAYRDEQQVFVEATSLRHLRQLLQMASTKQPIAVADFARCVHDVAGPASRLSQLTAELHRMVAC